MVEEKIVRFEMRYDSIVQRAGEEYEATPPSDYYRDGYNLYLRMVKYKHNHLLFLSNPLVEPDNNLCECLSVLDCFATNEQNNLYQSIKDVFRRPKLVMPGSENIKSSKTA